MSLFKIKRNQLATLHDACMAALSFVLSVYIRLGTDQWQDADAYIKQGTLVFTLTCTLIFIYMRMHLGLWRYASMQDMVTIFKGVTLAILIFAILMFTINRLDGLPRSVLFINWMLLVFMLGAPRFLFRAFKDRTLSWKTAFQSNARIPVLLIGAGDEAEQFIRDMARDSNAPYEVIGLIDNNVRQKGNTIHRVPIYGTIDALEHVIRKLERKVQRPQKLILSDDKTPGTTVRHLLERAEGLGIPLVRLPRLSEFKHGLHERPQLQPIAVEDLLGRAQNVLDRESMQALVHQKRVLVTGAGGTIGGELTRQICQFEPAELIIVELSEFNLYQIERELRGSFPHIPLTIVLSDVRDTHNMDVVFTKYTPQLVFHAAAIKHVPMAEFNIEEAILTNVFGTRTIAQVCHKHHVEVMVMISTDKAVNPANVMGATKKLAESFCQALGATQTGTTKTKFITVRFGNVLGSTGSVVPLFQEQLAKGGPITVTHPDMTRYFMTVREAVELVLQAAVQGVAMEHRQECIFVLDMGQPVRILDLANQMIRLAGFTPGKDIQVTFTGLRPGEKFYEELFHFSENAVKTSHESIFLASPRSCDMEHLRRSLDQLWVLCSERKTNEALQLLKTLVPEFQSLQPTSQ
jgi:FlaA1/EpsC-like NDP-sugar epimerase